jgi:L,D-transpeptidase YcbB
MIDMRGVRILHYLRMLRGALLAASLCMAAITTVLPGAAQAQSASQQDVIAAIRKQADGDVKSYYAARGFQPIWLKGNAFALHANMLIDQIENANFDGLKPDNYKPRRLRAAIFEAQNGSAKEIAAAELLLSSAFARYANDMRKPRDVGMRWLEPNLRYQSRDADAVLRAATNAPSFANYIRNVEWMSPHYVTTRSLLSDAWDRRASTATLKRIRLNLERARLLPGPWVLHIVVDAASGRLWYYQAGKEAGTMRVVVGKPASPTPMLAGTLQWAILNPYWNIPVDLTQSSVAPKVLKGRSLASMQMEALSDWTPTATKLNPKTINWKAVASGAQQLRVRQLPGPSNAMGRAKFMFPNDSGIYLHDTPERALLSKPKRHFSNGCIRLEDAPRLGQWLLGRSIAATGKEPEQAVPLKVPIPVFLTYLTAQKGTDGAAIFLDDVYSRDEDL